MRSDYAGLVHPLLRRVPRLQMLAVFESAARLGSFTAAAQELGISQPAVSRHVVGLERAIGSKLFARSANRVMLNAAGQSLLGDVRAAFATIELSLKELGQQAGVFWIAANPGFAQQWLLPYLDQLQSVLADVDLRLSLFDRDPELAGDNYDVAVHLTTVDGAPTDNHILFEERVVPVAAPSLATELGLHPDSPPEQLLEVALLHLDGRDRKWLTWQGWFAGHGVTETIRRPRLSYNNYAVVMSDAIGGMGVALAWRGLIEPHLASADLAVVGPELHRPEMAYQLVPSDSCDPEVIKRFALWLSELTPP